ncbi:MAG: lysophospholipid acyltransferase family protein [Candidatus Omnitrophota bacterium]|nr:lysophospholipid acyltransferase family protein [Candidatus Omnitrophota bacterium]
MDKNKILKSKFLKELEYGSSRVMIKLLVLIASWMSLGSIRKLGNVLGDIGYFIVFRHRQRTIANMKLVYGDQKSLAEIKQMTRQIFRYLSRCGCEIVYFCSRDNIKSAVGLVNSVEGEQYLRQAQKEGKGIIIISAHMGNFMLVGRKLTNMGYKTATIMRQMKDEKLEKLFTKWRNEKMGQHTIPKLPLWKSVRQSLDWLGQGNILAMYIDQRSGSGVWVDFFGIPTLTATGAAVFALRTGAPVVPLVVVNRNNGFYKLIIEQPVKMDNTGERKKDIETNTARFTKIIEKYVRKYPTQWFWVHNRWKEKRP